MNSSLIRAAKARGRYVHVSKPLVTVQRGVLVETVVSPAPGNTRVLGVKAAARAAKAIGLSVRYAKLFARTGGDPFNV